MKELRDYQIAAVEKICEFFDSDNNKAKIYMAAGLGKTAVIVAAVDEILKKYGKKDNISIAILTPYRMICEQFKAAFLEVQRDFKAALNINELTEEKILITTYQDVARNKSELPPFNLVICNEAEFVKSENIFSPLLKRNTKFLGILENPGVTETWFSNATCIFSYSMDDIIKNGYSVYAGERAFIQKFVIPLLEYQGYENIVQEKQIIVNNKRIRPDIIAEKDHETAIIEVKAYRGVYNSKSVLNNALKQTLQYEHYLKQNNKLKQCSFIIILPCEIDEESKNDIYDRYHIVVWDINNLVYLCEEKKELLNLLISCVPYSLAEVESRSPLNAEKRKEHMESEKTQISEVEKYLKKLDDCKPGDADARKYECICTDIIKYLFGTEFFKASEQHKTGDNMFRMDLLCSLKGTTEFWKFLITFYRTKFVVFEYKNYAEPVQQNLIYITEKYLFPAVLRNVAFIISRKGFDKNAEKAAMGCLKENGKLIISLTDDDLKSMLAMKEEGNEPSDYLLDKVEDILMSVSK